MNAEGVLGIARILFCCALLLPLAARADSPIAGFSFITEPQTISAQELSGACTIQAQNAAGNPQQSDETIDLSFSSTSASGEFLSAAGDPVKTVMNKGTANRSFYYRDASAGTHTLTVVAVGRVSGQSWIARQQIVVGSGGSGSVSVVSAPAVGAAPVSGSVSASPPAPAIEARAGPDRTAVAGASIDFTGAAIGLLGAPIENARFWWNFGDGATAEGMSVSHIFRVPGTYTVGLHISSGVYTGSDYVTVTVVPNKVVITEVVEGAQGFIRLWNGSEAAVDIGGWTITGGDGRKFVLPRSTMIRSKSDIALAHAVTGLSGVLSLQVHFPDGSFAFSYQSKPGTPEDTVTPVPISSIAVPPAPLARIETADAKSDQTTTTSPSHEEAALSRSYAAPAGIGTPGVKHSFFALAALLSASASVGFLFLKRFSP